VRIALCARSPMSGKCMSRTGTLQVPHKSASACTRTPNMASCQRPLEEPRRVRRGNSSTLIQGASYARTHIFLSRRQPHRRKSKWNTHCDIDSSRRSAKDSFTVLDVYGPMALLNGARSHRQWLVYEDGAGVVGIANGRWFRHRADQCFAASPNFRPPRPSGIER